MAEGAVSRDATPTHVSSTFPAVMTRAVVLGAVLWALSVVFFVGQAIAQVASTRPFDMATNLISDLGNTACGPDICSPLHTFVNVTFVVVGSFHILGAVAAYRAWPRRTLSAAGLVALRVAGAGLIVAGLNPENVRAAAHTIGALVGLIGLNLAMILLGAAIAPSKRWLAVMAVAAGCVGFIGLVLFLSASSAIPRGVAERLADWPGGAMVVVMGVYLLASAASRRQLRPARERTK